MFVPSSPFAARYWLAYSDSSRPGSRYVVYEARTTGMVMTATVCNPVIENPAFHCLQGIRVRFRCIPPSASKTSNVFPMQSTVDGTWGRNVDESPSAPLPELERLKRPCSDDPLILLRLVSTDHEVLTMANLSEADTLWHISIRGRYVKAAWGDGDFQ